MDPNKENGAELEDGIEIDIVDDNQPNEPVEPEGSAEPDEGAQQRQEMDSYSKNVQKRIDKLTYAVNEERRRAEELRKRAEAAEEYAKAAFEENQKYQETLNWGRNEYFNEVNARLDLAQQLAEQSYRKAYEEGNADEIIKAQQVMQDITIRKAQMANMPPPVPREDFKLPEREAEPEFVSQQAQQQYAEPTYDNYDEQLQDEPEPDIKVQEWTARNPWYGPEGDQEMTFAALGVHTALVKRGVDTSSDEYYAALDARMAQLFPEKLGKPRRPSQVAPAGRSTATKKVALSKRQESFGNKYNVPLERIAREQMKINGEI